MYIYIHIHIRGYITTYIYIYLFIYLFIHTIQYQCIIPIFSSHFRPCFLITSPEEAQELVERLVHVQYQSLVADPVRKPSVAQSRWSALQTHGMCTWGWTAASSRKSGASQVPLCQPEVKMPPKPLAVLI